MLVEWTGAVNGWTVECVDGVRRGVTESEQLLKNTYWLNKHVDGAYHQQIHNVHNWTEQLTCCPFAAIDFCGGWAVDDDDNSGCSVTMLYVRCCDDL